MSSSRLRSQREPTSGPSTAVSGTRGLLTGCADTGDPLVDYPSNPTGAPVGAATTVDLTAKDIGREVILVFEDGDLARPIIIGLIAAPTPGKQTKTVDITADGKRVTIAADDEIVLKCGEASITLTKAGKILIRGAYVLSRSSGTNRIKGGSVQIN